MANESDLLIYLLVVAIVTVIFIFLIYERAKLAKLHHKRQK